MLVSKQWSYHSPQLQVLREHFPTVLFSTDIVGAILPPLGTHPHTMQHQQRLKFPSETHGCSGWLWRLWWNLVSSDRELPASRRPGDESRWVPSSVTVRLESGDVYTPSESHVYYTLRRRCCYAATVDAMPGDNYALLRPSATFYLSTIAIYQMPHFPPNMFSFETLLLIIIQSSLQIHRLPLNMFCHCRTLPVRNIISTLHTI